jgi:cytoskeletal protein CcmA (bactofilin family)
MWNREKNESPNNLSDIPQNAPSSENSTRSVISREFGDSAPAPSSPQVNRTPRGTIGKSIVIRGELTGNEDLTIEGTVEGKIDLLDHNLIIGPSGRIKAEVGAKKIIVEGEVNGNINAGEKVELCSTGRVKGDIIAPRVVIADGAHFKGMVNMGTSQKAESHPKPVSEAKKDATAKHNAPAEAKSA